MTYGPDRTPAEQMRINSQTIRELRQRAESAERGLKVARDMISSLSPFWADKVLTAIKEAMEMTEQAPTNKTQKDRYTVPLPF